MTHTYHTPLKNAKIENAYNKCIYIEIAIIVKYYPSVHFTLLYFLNSFYNETGVIILYLHKFHYLKVTCMQEKNFRLHTIRAHTYHYY